MFVFEVTFPHPLWTMKTEVTVPEHMGRYAFVVAVAGDKIKDACGFDPNDFVEHRTPEMVYVGERTATELQKIHDEIGGKW